MPQCEGAQNICNLEIYKTKEASLANFWSPNEVSVRGMTRQILRDNILSYAWKSWKMIDISLGSWIM